MFYNPQWYYNCYGCKCSVRMPCDLILATQAECCGKPLHMNFFATAASFVGSHEIGLIENEAQMALVTEILRGMQNLSAEALQMLSLLATPTLNSYLPRNVLLVPYEPTAERNDEPLSDYQVQPDHLRSHDWDLTL